jgi:hypothetical protein
MKILLTITFLATSFYSIGQNKRFDNANDFGLWMMNYYKNPKPDELYEAFRFGTHDKEIAKAGSRAIMMGFFSSCLRNDTLRQMDFFNRLQKTKDENFIYGFWFTLWLIHSDFSLNLMDNFQKLKQIQKYNRDFEEIKNGKFLNIWTDPIVEAEHLDMLWADFFATGNEGSIKKIITKLSDLDSKNYVDKVTAGSAKWSLTSNSITHDKVLETCQRQREISDDKIKATLDQIIEEANKQRKSGG